MASIINVRVAFLVLCILYIRADVLRKITIQPSEKIYNQEGDRTTSVFSRSNMRLSKNKSIPVHLLNRMLKKPASHHQVELIELGPVAVKTAVPKDDADALTSANASSHDVEKPEKMTEFEEAFSYRKEHPSDKSDPSSRCPILDAIDEPPKSIELADREPEVWILPGYGFQGLVISLISNLYEAPHDMIPASDLAIVDHCRWNHLRLSTFQQTWTYPDTWGVEVWRDNRSFYLNSSLSWWTNFFHGYRVEAVCRLCAVSTATPPVCTPSSQTTLKTEVVAPETTTLSDFETEVFSRDHTNGMHWHPLPRPKAPRETSETEEIHKEKEASSPLLWVWVGPLIACFILSAALVITCTVIGWIRNNISGSYPVLDAEEGEQGTECLSTVFESPESEISQSTTPLTWDDCYVKELSNFKSSGDVGEIWYGEDNSARVLRWFEDNEDLRPETSILDIGCGNGVFLLDLSDRGFTNLQGVDYSQAAIELSKTIAREKDVDIRFEQGDAVTGTGDLLKRKYQICHDKGTFDAISLCPEDAGKKCAAYLNNVHNMLEDNGLLVITCCNWTDDELAEKLSHYFEKFYIIPTPTFIFGGKVGRQVTSMVFRKVN
ncbi:uncharacterized protein LOC143034990 [Oratosquilla oratoria]|uniref:uncharacterized protein LOC143034990 n=1 Tax=Oratosquilla oratoria TaxID=337810 RepID=UPI003F763EDE